VQHVPHGSIEWEAYRSPKGSFEGAEYFIEEAMRADENRHPFSVLLLRIPPGKRPWPFHWHAAQWEFYYVLEGAGAMRLEGETVSLRAGDALMCAPREAHQLHNTGDADLVVQIVADNPPADYCYYPDSGKWGVAGKHFRMVEAPYYDGEE
jgi:mannose-6-phosphate isomerase-like protein (cupin superfamily)